MNRSIDTKVLITFGGMFLITACVWSQVAPCAGVIFAMFFLGLLLLGFRRQIGSAMFSLAELASGTTSTPSLLYVSSARTIERSLPKKRQLASDVKYAALAASAWVKSGVEEVDGEHVLDHITQLMTPYVVLLDPSEYWSQLLLYRFAQAAYVQGRFEDAYALTGRAPIGKHNLNEGCLLELVWVRASAALSAGRRAEAEREYSRLYAAAPDFWGVRDLGQSLWGPK